MHRFLGGVGPRLAGLAGLSLTGLAGLVGCGPDPLDRDPFAEWTERDARLGELRDELSREVGEVETTASAGNAEPAELGEDAGVETYVELALERNPRLTAARQRVARLAERVPQATSLEDPRFSVAPVGEMAETAAGRVELKTGLSQELPWPGKLKAKGRAAGQRVAEAAAEMERTRQRIIGDVRRAYWRLYSTARSIEVMEASRSLLERFRAISEARYRAGTANQQDVLRASVELSNLKKELHTLHQRRSAAEAMLNRLLDRPAEASLPDPPRVSVEETAGELEGWLQRAERSNPALRAVRERIERHRQEVELAALQRWPNLTVGANYNAVDGDGLADSTTGKDQWWLSLGFNLPIWDRKLDAAENEARRGVLEGLAELRSARNRVGFQVREAFDRMHAHREHVTLLSESIVPESRQAAEAALSRYRTGADNALTVIDNWQRMLEFERMRYQHRAMYEEAVADLRQAVGRELRNDKEAEREASDGAAEPEGAEREGAESDSAEREGAERDRIGNDGLEREGAEPDAEPSAPDDASSDSPAPSESPSPEPSATDNHTASEPPADAPDGTEATEDQP